MSSANFIPDLDIRGLAQQYASALETNGDISSVTASFMADLNKYKSADGDVSVAPTSTVGMPAVSSPNAKSGRVDAVTPGDRQVGSPTSVSSELNDSSSDWLPEYFAALVEAAKGAWISLPEAASFLRRGAQKACDIIYDAVGPVGPPVRPEGGSVFIVDERRLPNWREDGFRYTAMPSDPRHRPSAGIQYSDGSVYGSRSSSSSSTGTKVFSPGSSTSVTADVITLTFLQSTINSPGSEGGFGRRSGLNSARSAASGGDFAEQTLVLEWAVVDRHDWQSTPSAAATSSGPNAHLQRRALRLPRLGTAVPATSGSDVLMSPGGSGSSSLSTAAGSGSAPGAGWIWLVQYLPDVMPPRYTPDGGPVADKSKRHEGYVDQVLNTSALESAATGAAADTTAQSGAVVPPVRAPPRIPTAGNATQSQPSTPTKASLAANNDYAQRQSSKSTSTQQQLKATKAANLSSIDLAAEFAAMTRELDDMDRGIQQSEAEQARAEGRGVDRQRDGGDFDARDAAVMPAYQQLPSFERAAAYADDYQRGQSWHQHVAAVQSTHAVNQSIGINEGEILAALHSDEPSGGLQMYPASQSQQQQYNQFGHGGQQYTGQQVPHGQHDPAYGGAPTVNEAQQALLSAYHQAASQSQVGYAGALLHTAGHPHNGLGMSSGSLQGSYELAQSHVGVESYVDPQHQHSISGGSTQYQLQQGGFHAQAAPHSPNGRTFDGSSAGPWAAGVNRQQVPAYGHEDQHQQFIANQHMQTSFVASLGASSTPPRRGSALLPSSAPHTPQQLLEQPQQRLQVSDAPVADASMAVMIEQRKAAAMELQAKRVELARRLQGGATSVAAAPAQSTAVAASETVQELIAMHEAASTGEPAPPPGAAEEAVSAEAIAAPPTAAVPASLPEAAPIVPPLSGGGSMQPDPVIQARRRSIEVHLRGSARAAPAEMVAPPPAAAVEPKAVDAKIAGGAGGRRSAASSVTYSLSHQSYDDEEYHDDDDGHDQGSLHHEDLRTGARSAGSSSVTTHSTYSDSHDDDDRQSTDGSIVIHRQQHQHEHRHHAHRGHDDGYLGYADRHGYEMDARRRRYDARGRSGGYEQQYRRAGADSTRESSVVESMHRDLTLDAQHSDDDDQQLDVASLDELHQHDGVELGRHQPAPSSAWNPRGSYAAMHRAQLRSSAAHIDDGDEDDGSNHNEAEDEGYAAMHRKSLIGVQHQLYDAEGDGDVDIYYSHGAADVYRFATELPGGNGDGDQHSDDSDVDHGYALGPGQADEGDIAGGEYDDALGMEEDDAVEQRYYEGAVAADVQYTRDPNGRQGVAAMPVQGNARPVEVPRRRYEYATRAPQVVDEQLDDGHRHRVRSSREAPAHEHRRSSRHGEDAHRDRRRDGDNDKRRHSSGQRRSSSSSSGSRSSSSDDDATRRRVKRREDRSDKGHGGRRGSRRQRDRGRTSTDDEEEDDRRGRRHRRRSSREEAEPSRNRRSSREPAPSRDGGHRRRRHSAERPRVVDRYQAAPSIAAVLPQAPIPTYVTAQQSSRTAYVDVGGGRLVPVQLPIEALAPGPAVPAHVPPAVPLPAPAVVASLAQASHAVSDGRTSAMYNHLQAEAAAILEEQTRLKLVRDATGGVSAAIQQSAGGYGGNLRASQIGGFYGGTAGAGRFGRHGGPGSFNTFSASSSAGYDSAFPSGRSYGGRTSGGPESYRDQQQHHAGNHQHGADQYPYAGRHDAHHHDGIDYEQHHSHHQHHDASQRPHHSHHPASQEVAHGPSHSNAHEAGVGDGDADAEDMEVEMGPYGPIRRAKAPTAQDEDAEHRNDSGEGQHQPPSGTKKQRSAPRSVEQQPSTPDRPPSPAPRAAPASPPLPAQAKRLAQRQREAEEREGDDDDERQGRSDDEHPQHGDRPQVNPAMAGTGSSAAAAQRSPLAKPGARKSATAAIAAVTAGEVHYANVGSGVVTLDPSSQYAPFCDTRVAAALGACIPGWRVRALFRLKKVRDMRNRILDTKRLLSEVKTSGGNGGGDDDAFTRSLTTQLEGEVREMVTLFTGSNGDGPGSSVGADVSAGGADSSISIIELTSYLRTQLKLKKGKPIKGPLIPVDASNRIDDAEAEAAARGASRAAARKSRLKGGAVGKAVMARYSLAPKPKADGDDDDASTNDGDSSIDGGGSSIAGEGSVSHPPEKPWLKAKKAGAAASKAASLAGADEDVVVVAPPKRRSAFPPGGPGAGLASKDKDANGLVSSRDEDDASFGSSLPASGKWRVLVEVNGAKNLAPALYHPGTLAAGPGLVGGKLPPSDPSALAPDPGARDTYAVAYLAKAPAAAAKSKTAAAAASAAAPSRPKVIGKKMQTEVAPKSLEPTWRKRFLFSLPVRAGLSDDQVQALVQAGTAAMTQADGSPTSPAAVDADAVASLASSPPSFTGWEVRLEVVDNDRYVKDTFMGEAWIGLGDMRVQAGKAASLPLQAKEAGDRVKGTMQVRYRLVPPAPELRVQVLQQEAVAMAAGSSGAALEGDAGAALGAADGAVAGAGGFLKRKSANLKPRKVDWSNVQSKTNSRLDTGGAVAAGSSQDRQQSGGGGRGVRMYKRPDYSRVRSKVAEQAGLVPDDEPDNIVYGNRQPAGKAGKGGSAGAAPARGRAADGPSTRARSKSGKRKDLDDFSNTGGPGYTRYVSYDSDLLVDGGGGGDGAHGGAAATGRNSKAGKPPVPNQRNSRRSLSPQSKQPSAASASERITREDMQRVFDRGLRGGNDERKGAFNGRRSNVGGGGQQLQPQPTRDAAGAIEYNPDSWRGDPSMWLGQDNLAVRMPDSPALQQSPSSSGAGGYRTLDRVATGSSSSRIPRLDMSKQRSGSVSSAPYSMPHEHGGQATASGPSRSPQQQLPDVGNNYSNYRYPATSGAVVPSDNAQYGAAFRAATGAQSHQAQSAHHTGDIMESLGAAIDRFFNASTSQDDAAGVYPPSSRLKHTVPSLPPARAMDRSLAAAASSSPPRLHNDPFASSIRSTGPVALSPELKAILFGSRDASTTTAAAPLPARQVPAASTTAGLGELTRAAIAAVTVTTGQQSQQRNASVASSLSVSDEASRFAAEIRRSMAAGKSNGSAASGITLASSSLPLPPQASFSKYVAAGQAQPRQ